MLKLPSVNKQIFDMVAGTLSFQGVALICIICFLHYEKLSWREAFGFKTSSTIKAITVGAIAAFLVVPIALMLQMYSVDFLKWLSHLLHFKFQTAPQEVVKTLQQARGTAGSGLLR